MFTAFKPVMMVVACCVALLGACRRDVDFSMPAQRPVARPASVRVPAAAPIRLVEEVAPLGDPFDIGRVPLAEVPEKPFPYLTRPKAAGEKFHRSRVAYERSFIFSKGRSHWVDRRRQLTRFRNKDAKLDRVSAMRRYEAALQALGATSVHALAPWGENFGTGDLYSQAESRLPGPWVRYLIRTPKKTIWLGLDIDNIDTRIMVLEERPMKASIGLTKW